MGDSGSQSHSKHSIEDPNWFLGGRLSVNQTYRIYTDGSAIGNPGPGGWGAVVMQGRVRWQMSECLSLDHHLGDGVGRCSTATSATSGPGAR